LLSYLRASSAHSALRGLKYNHLAETSGPIILYIAKKVSFSSIFIIDVTYNNKTKINKVETFFCYFIYIHQRYESDQLSQLEYFYRISNVLLVRKE